MEMTFRGLLAGFTSGEHEWRLISCLTVSAPYVESPATCLTRSGFKVVQIFVPVHITQLTGLPAELGSVRPIRVCRVALLQLLFVIHG